MEEKNAASNEPGEDKIEDANQQPDNKEERKEKPYVKQAEIGKFMDQFLPTDVFHDKGGRTVCVVGEKENGKSNLIYALVAHGGFLFDQVWLITLDTDGELTKLCNHPFMALNNVNEAFFAKLIRLQKQRSKKKRKNVLLIFDDFIGMDMDLRKSKALREIASRNRHLKISVLFSTQKFKELPDIFRKNGQWWFLGKNVLSSIDQLVTELASVQLDKARMRSLLCRIAAEDAFEFLGVKNCRPGGFVHFRPPLLKPEEDEDEDDDEGSDHDEEEPGEPDQKRARTA